MVVSKKYVLLFLLITFSSISYSQEVKKSFVFQNEAIASCLKKTVESYGYYLSFRQEIFQGRSSVSGNYQHKTMSEMLEALLKDEFRYKVIKDYVIINPVDKPIPTTVKKPKPVVYDTITIEKVVVKYDTQVVERKEIIYDTIKIQKREIVYDTIAFRDSTFIDSDKWHLGGFFGPVVRKRQGENLKADYFGVSIGASVQYELRNFHFQFDGSYQYLINTISNSSIAEVTETRTDTISTFFVIENGVRTPVYITEDMEVTREIQTNVERTNTLQFLSFSLVSGYTLNFNNFSVGMDLGINADWLLKRDELVFIDNMLLDNNDVQYNSPALSLVVQVPIRISKTDLIGSFIFTPYFQYGINEEFKNPLLEGKRLVSGIKIGVMF